MLRCGNTSSFKRPGNLKRHILDIHQNRSSTFINHKPGAQRRRTNPLIAETSSPTPMDLTYAPPTPPLPALAPPIATPTLMPFLSCTASPTVADRYLKVPVRDQEDQSRSAKETGGTAQNLMKDESLVVIGGQAAGKEEEEAGSEAEADRKEAEEAELDGEGQTRARASRGLQDKKGKGKQGTGGVAVKGTASRKKEEETGAGRGRGKKGKGKARG